MAVAALAAELRRSTPVPIRVIAKKRCRVMVEPPERKARAAQNPTLSIRPKPPSMIKGREK
jgi:hypothetical protein